MPLFLNSQEPLGVSSHSWSYLVCTSWLDYNHILKNTQNPLSSHCKRRYEGKFNKFPVGIKGCMHPSKTAKFP